ncbi:MAG: asparagine--tRNA ligase [Candidatus Marinimicrobia bacterium]|nr:asparagine--tRNA ligase [Candidatus Neomarinimicrobiota bacterium]
MNRVYINNLSSHVDEEVTINGWLYNKRSSGKIAFIIVRDGTGRVQGVVSKSDVSDEVFDKIGLITQESSLSITGTVKEEKRSEGGYEIQVTAIKIHQVADEYPISPKEHGTAFLMDNRHLWLRSRRQHAILKIRHTIIKACRDFFDERDFVLVDTPIFTPTSCEGTTTLFETEYFGRIAYLAQSGQLYSEASAASLGRVYCFGPTFRAEKSKTRRHLTEFWMVEPEVAYSDLEDNMKLAEEFVSYVVQKVLETKTDELKILERDLTNLENVVPPFPRISYTEAVKKLNDSGHKFEWGGDFGGEDETILAEMFDKPVLVHRYPAAVKAFYMKRDNDNDDLALGVDMLAPEGYGEIIGGGEREDNYDIIHKRLKEYGLSVKEFEWYLDLRKYGTFPHSGFGMGIERVVAWICGLKHIRESIPFPRMIHRLEP